MSRLGRLFWLPVTVHGAVFGWVPVWVGKVMLWIIVTLMIVGFLAEFASVVNAINDAAPAR